MGLHWNCSGQFGGGFSWCFRCRFHWPLVWRFCQSPSGSLVGLLVGDFFGHGVVDLVGVIVGALVGLLVGTLVGAGAVAVCQCILAEILVEFFGHGVVDLVE